MSRLYDVLVSGGVVVLRRNGDGIAAKVLHENPDPRNQLEGPVRADIDSALDGLEDALGEVFDARKRRTA